MASNLSHLKAAGDTRTRSFSVAGPLTETQKASGISQSTTPTRRMSRALDVKPGFRSETPFWHWIQQHVDKQLIGLSINFLILIVLLMLLKMFVQWLQLAQAARGNPADGK